jgi:hypothetical protein
MSRSSLVLTLLLTCFVDSRCFANGWTPLANQPRFSAGTMLLLTDGRVLVNDTIGSVHWWLLTPDGDGSYVNGTWSDAGNSNCDRLFFASAVLADGRVIMSGGEESSRGGDMTNETEIYDPVQRLWTRIAPPTGWDRVGDAPSCLLSDGTWLLGSIFDPRTAIFDPASDTWTSGPDVLNASSFEESWALMPGGSVISVECLGHPKSKRYEPSLAAWVDSRRTPVDLVGPSLEIGPAVLMNDGRAFFMGATPHCALYTAPGDPNSPGTWTQGGDPPEVDGQDVACVDGPGSLLPNGNVLCPLAPLWPSDDRTNYFFEFDGANFFRVPDPPNNQGPLNLSRMLLLPTGEVLFAAGTIYAYTCDGAPNSGWKPTVSSVSDELLRGEDYPLSGTQLNGLSQAVGYGDDSQAATNYPLVRLTVQATHHVFYCRTHGHSTMAVATGPAIVSTNFHVPEAAETGPATLEVVANGIPSDSVAVTIGDPVTIDFDQLAAGVQITSQYSQAKFSSDPGFANWTDAVSTGSSLPNAVTTGPAAGGIDGTHSTFIDFTCPVVALTFRGIGIDDVGAVATVNVFEHGSFSGTVIVNGAGAPSTPVRVDVTGFHEVTRIEIVNLTDAGGIAWDDFVFGIPSATWSNYGTGFPGANGVPSLTSRQNPILATTITLEVGNSSKGATIGLLLFGFQQATIPTGKGGDLLLVPVLFFPVWIPVGGATAIGSIPDDEALCGVKGYAQAIELDPGAARGVSFTQGLELVFGH